MHPDLDLSGVLREAYRRDLEAEAAKVRLLSSLKRSVNRQARREEILLPLARLLVMLVPLMQRLRLGFGQVQR